MLERFVLLPAILAVAAGCGPKAASSSGATATAAAAPTCVDVRGTAWAGATIADLSWQTSDGPVKQTVTFENGASTPAGGSTLALTVAEPLAYGDADLD